MVRITGVPGITRIDMRRGSIVEIPLIQSMIFQHELSNCIYHYVIELTFGFELSKHILHIVQ